MVDVTDPLSRAIAEIENEFIVRGFIDVWNESDVQGLAPFLHRDIRFRGMAGAAARGRPAVMHVCSEILAAFAEIRIEMTNLAFAGDCVFVEERLLVSEHRGEAAVALSGFASFVVNSQQITSWRQFHCVRL